MPGRRGQGWSLPAILFCNVEVERSWQDETTINFSLNLQFYSSTVDKLQVFTIAEAPSEVAANLRFPPGKTALASR